MTRIAVSMCVTSDQPEQIIRALDVFSRAQSGLVLDGIDVTVYAEPLADETVEADG